MFNLFPVLKERANGKAGLLSGGEQQMLAIGRAVMAHPTVVMIDEASLGLSPILTRKIFELIVALNEQGTTVLAGRAEHPHGSQGVPQGLRHEDRAHRS